MHGALTERAVEGPVLARHTPTAPIERKVQGESAEKKGALGATSDGGARGAQYGVAPA